MTRRTPAQKLARKLQAETGKPYTACLAEAKTSIAEQAPPAAHCSVKHCDPDLCGVHAKSGCTWQESTDA